MTVWRVSTVMIELFLQVEEIWGWPVFKQLVGLEGCPWEAGNEPAEWLENDKEILTAVLSFLSSLEPIDSKEERRAIMEGKRGTQREGRNALQSWFAHKCQKEWKIKQLFQDVMEENELTPLAIMNAEQLVAVSL